jgi:hypothetical protein
MNAVNKNRPTAYRCVARGIVNIDLPVVYYKIDYAVVSCSFLDNICLVLGSVV